MKPNVKRLRGRASFLRDRLATAAGLTARGYFVPYPYAGSVERGIKTYPAVLERFDAERDRYAECFRRIEDLAEPFAALWREFRLETGMFPPRDAAVAYALVRTLRPRRIIEIGSGSSTRVMTRAIADGGFTCAITCIDPSPRSTLQGLAVEHIPRVLDVEDEALAATLEAGDILFVDSSHVMLPGMDVDIEFNLMFPRLAQGVVVHVHDIFLPYGYPFGWSRREYSEQNALVGWIFGNHFEVLVPNHYVSRNCPDFWEGAADVAPELRVENAGSIWLRRV